MYTEYLEKQVNAFTTFNNECKQIILDLSQKSLLHYKELNQTKVQLSAMQYKHSQAIDEIETLNNTIKLLQNNNKQLADQLASEKERYADLCLIFNDAREYYNNH